MPGLWGYMYVAWPFHFAVDALPGMRDVLISSVLCLDNPRHLGFLIISSLILDGIMFAGSDDDYISILCGWYTEMVAFSGIDVAITLMSPWASVSMSGEHMLIWLEMQSRGLTRSSAETTHNIIVLVT